MKELIEKVVQWGVDRGLDKVGHLPQAKYTLKETAELLDAYADGDVDAMNDAIGDILVTLIVGASNDEYILHAFSVYMRGDAFGESFKESHGDFSDNYAMLVRCGFCLMKEYPCDLLYADIAYWLNYILSDINREFDQDLSLKDCLELAYNEIKDRKGKKINGQFKKDQ